MISAFAGALLGVLLGLIVVMVVQFIDVTLWQCRKFGNCPWYLEWINND